MINKTIQESVVRESVVRESVVRESVVRESVVPSAPDLTRLDHRETAGSHPRPRRVRPRPPGRVDQSTQTGVPMSAKYHMNWASSGA